MIITSDTQNSNSCPRTKKCRLDSFQTGMIDDNNDDEQQSQKVIYSKSSNQECIQQTPSVHGLN
jgi:hypothetical protein